MKTRQTMVFEYTYKYTESRVNCWDCSMKPLDAMIIGDNCAYSFKDNGDFGLMPTLPIGKDGKTTVDIGRGKENTVVVILFADIREIADKCCKDALDRLVAKRIDARIAAFKSQGRALRASESFSHSFL